MSENDGLSMIGAIEPIVVIGAAGMLGRAFAGLLARESRRFGALDLPELDLLDAASVVRGVPLGTRTVINCAGSTDVDGAEADESVAVAVNGQGVGTLAARCKAVEATLVHFSTDYVFDGEAVQPYSVDHPLAPLNAYGRSKALGERLLTQAGTRYLLIRTSWMYAPWGDNFVLTMRELMHTRASLRVVDDQVGRPTSAQYLALRTLDLLGCDCSGVFHVTDGGQCSRYGLACTIAALTRASCQVVPCTSAEFPRPARRPAYSVLDLGRVEAVLGPSVAWQDNLAAVLDAVGLAAPGG